jgi:UDP-N-acetylmuramate dehydrogenase
MRIEKDVDLYKYSTMRTHSVGATLYTPENIEDLKKLLLELHGEYYFLGGGSNVVFASRVEMPIVNLMELNNEVVLIEDGMMKAGCSVRIQKLINFGKEHALGGFEYLYSLPASVGGIVYMNAGRSRIHHQQISDWLESVEYLDLTDMQIKTMNVDKRQWTTYRCSPFHQMKAVILSATFRMKKSSVEEVEAKIQERKDTVKSGQEGNKPSCGSVFKKNNKYIMRLLRGKRIGGACYSKKTNNWISNDQNGTADDVIALIHKTQMLHRLFFQKCNLEIKIFE